MAHRIPQAVPDGTLGNSKTVQGFPTGPCGFLYLRALRATFSDLGRGLLDELHYFQQHLNSQNNPQVKQSTQRPQQSTPTETSDSFTNLMELHVKQKCPQTEKTEFAS